MSKNTDVPASDDEARQRFRSDAAVQRDFSWAGEGAYVAWCKAARAGQAKRIGAPPPDDAGIPATDDAARTRYAASPSLQREFRTESAYVAYMRAVREGKTRVL